MSVIPTITERGVPVCASALGICAVFVVFLLKALRKAAGDM